MIKELNPRPFDAQDDKLQDAFTRIQKLVSTLQKKELAEDIAEEINSIIEKINASAADDKRLLSILKESFKDILILSKISKLDETSEFINTWSAYGIPLFGLPIGVILFILTSNPTYIGIGLPIGLFIGSFIGYKRKQSADKDKVRKIQKSFAS
jgi:hypothetical protein